MTRQLELRPCRLLPNQRGAVCGDAHAPRRSATATATDGASATPHLACPACRTPRRPSWSTTTACLAATARASRACIRTRACSPLRAPSARALPPSWPSSRRSRSRRCARARRPPGGSVCAATQPPRRGAPFAPSGRGRGCLPTAQAHPPPAPCPGARSARSRPRRWTSSPPSAAGSSCLSPVTCRCAPRPQGEGRHRSLGFAGPGWRREACQRRSPPGHGTQAPILGDGSGTEHASSASPATRAGVVRCPSAQPRVHNSAPHPLAPSLSPPAAALHPPPSPLPLRAAARRREQPAEVQPGVPPDARGHQLCRHQRCAAAALRRGAPLVPARGAARGGHACRRLAHMRGR